MLGLRAELLELGDSGPAEVREHGSSLSVPRVRTKNRVRHERRLPPPLATEGKQDAEPVASIPSFGVRCSHPLISKWT